MTEQQNNVKRRGLKLAFVTFLTFARLPLVLIFFTGAIFFAFNNRPWVFAMSFGSLVIAAVTDLFDGYFARKFKVETKLGAHADPLMDKFFYLATLLLLVFVAMRNGHITHAVILLVMTLCFLARDQWVTFLRSIGALYGVSGRANWSGKLRTALNLPMMCVIYYFEESPWPLISREIVWIFEGITFFINFLSLYIYTSFYWPCLIKSINLGKNKDD